jgi:hypothetical protein
MAKEREVTSAVGNPPAHRDSATMNGAQLLMAQSDSSGLMSGAPAKGGIASDESTVKVLEIGANEGPVEEHMSEPDESAAAKGDSGNAGCPILMGYYNSPKCSRKVHVAPVGIDSTPVCLMLSKDPGKQSGPLFDKFWVEFERILKKAGEKEAHFNYFVFPQCSFNGRAFQAICRFDHATFTQDADFGFTTFSKNAEFYKATFAENAYFNYATFTQYANFRQAIFTQNADFVEAMFTRNLSFLRATFTKVANFIGATFTQDALFDGATFAENAYFSNTTFKQNTYFSYVTFSQAVNFADTIFLGTTVLQSCRFLDRLEFRRTRFAPQISGQASALFTLAKFSKPGEIVFDDVDLSRSLFHNCDVSQVWFSSSVQWGTRGNNRGLVVFDETIPLEQTYGGGLLRDGRRDYRAVAQIYHQLKKNYDSRLDYWTANEFHFGEMEMKRLAGPTEGRLLWLRRWWHRNLSFVAWYKYASDYGNSYRKPLLWLLGILLAAALLFPITGLELKQAVPGDPNSTSVTYSSVWDRQNSWANNFWTEAKLIGKSGITAIDTATFQRTPEYAPAYPWGRVVGIFETLLTSSLFALFLLAIRRQFRR